MKYESNYLCHYGVKGMKWGVRHDPDKVIKYKNKLQAKAQRRSDNRLREARKLHREYEDLRKNGTHSKSWDEEVERRANANSRSFLDSTNNPLIDVGASFIAYSTTKKNLKNNKTAMREYKYSIAAERDEYSDAARRWEKSSDALRNTYVTPSMKKKDIRKTYWTGKSTNPYRG